jgi:hypothetical protein
VLKDGQRLLARDLAATTTREGQTLSRYCDYVPQLHTIEAAHRLRVSACVSVAEASGDERRSVALCAKLRPLAGFRNALVHGYLRLDFARVHSVLNEHLEELREFAREVDAVLQR